jgi:hypothetical protein
MKDGPTISLKTQEKAADQILISASERARKANSSGGPGAAL